MDKVTVGIVGIMCLLVGANIGSVIGKHNRQETIVEACATTKEYVLETYAENIKLTLQCAVVLK